MSHFPDRPRRSHPEQSAARAANHHNWGAVPPPKRDQRPRPPRSHGDRPPRPSAHSSAPASAREATVYSQPVTPHPPAIATATSDEPQRKPFFKHWMFWSFLMVAGLGGIAGMSAVSLIRIPNLPNCRAIFWPAASAATRLQCADAYADQGSVENLLAAIALVEALPDDHPLRPEINQRVETWATQILDIADQTFHEGELERAIEIAEAIPANTAAADEVSDRVTEWQGIWEQALSIFREAEGHLQSSQFREAFAAAIQLRSVDNRYWASARYEELVSLITRTREEVNILANAERLARGGSVDDILAAVAQVAAIESDSYIYAEAQAVLKDISRELLTLAEAALDRENSAEALTILNKIPPVAELNAEIADFRTIIEAYELTWSGTTVGYESAIVKLQSISSDRPLHDRAEALKDRWRQTLEAVAQLNWAKRIAQPGSPADLRAAIAEAELIDANNPFWGDAQAYIEQWRQDIAEVEDRPFLDRAKIYASRGDRAALQAAIVEASNIESDSALYAEAQSEIADWRWEIQRRLNEPILSQARQLARSGQLAQAVAVASQIPADEALYDEAQTAIADWQSTQQGQQVYQQAVLTAQSGSINALVEAIGLAQSVPESSADWAQAQRLANQWSWQLLDFAEADANRGEIMDAIAIASQIPPQTEAYASAQLRIRDWEKTPETISQ